MTNHLVALLLITVGLMHSVFVRAEDSNAVPGSKTDCTEYSKTLADAEIDPQASIDAGESTAPSQAPESQQLININLASADEFRTLKGIGQAKAKAIIDYRDTEGPFLSVDDLIKVKGIGPALLERHRETLTLSAVK